MARSGSGDLKPINAAGAPAIGLINLWNRLATGFRYTHPVGAARRPAPSKKIGK